MTTFNRRQTLGLIGAGAAAAGGLATPAIAQNKKAVVGALSLASHAASFVALDRGYFADAGLDVELKFFQAAQPMAVAIASRDVDFGVTAITGGLINLANKGAVKVIGGALREAPGVDGQLYLASDAAYKDGLTSLEQLDGKRYGVTTAGSSFHYMGAKAALLTDAAPTFVPLQKVGAIIGALKSGQVDAWSIVPHIAKALVGSGAVHEIGTVESVLPDYQVTTVFTSERNAADDPALTESFLAGFTKGVADYNATMVDKTEGEAAIDEMVKIIHQYVYTDRPLEKAAPPIKAGAMRLSEGASLNLTSVRDQLEWMQAEGLIDASIGLDSVVNTDYVEIVGA